MGISSIELNMSLYGGVSSNQLSFKGMPILTNESDNSDLFDIFEEVEIKRSGLSSNFSSKIVKFVKEKTPYVLEKDTWHEGEQKVFKSKFDLDTTCEMLKEKSKK